ncbi:hypothetical protein BJV78DRAFT_1156717 [Lactifluus subvellereus]|nr:hypothetical protein BJV78DRAFT_1156717 [Lactifluus subvellereus]
MQCFALPSTTYMAKLQGLWSLSSPMFKRRAQLVASLIPETTPTDTSARLARKPVQYGVLVLYSTVHYFLVCDETTIAARTLPNSLYYSVHNSYTACRRKRAEPNFGVLIKSQQGAFVRPRTPIDPKSNGITVTEMVSVAKESRHDKLHFTSVPWECLEIPGSLRIGKLQGRYFMMGLRFVRVGEVRSALLTPIRGDSGLHGLVTLAQDGVLLPAKLSCRLLPSQNNVDNRACNKLGREGDPVSVGLRIGKGFRLSNVTVTRTCPTTCHEGVLLDSYRH